MLPNIPMPLPAQETVEWDETEGAYIALVALTIDGNSIQPGQVIPAEAIDQAVFDVVAAAENNMVSVSTQLQEGSISLAEWETAMLQEIKSVNLATSMIARGGWEQMSGADFNFVGSTIEDELGFLERFAGQISTGEAAIIGAGFLNRARQYAKAARGNGGLMGARLAAQNQGAVEARRVLGIADHCRDSGSREGCIELANKGWQPLELLVPIGDATCHENCKCHIEYRRADGSVFRL